MNAAQTSAAWDLLGSLLSARGLDQVRRQLTIERILGELSGSPSFRDPGNYALVIFGDPAGNAPWAWRFEGHHLSLSVLVAPGHGVAVTPAFFGANPAQVPRGHAHGGFRLIGAEEDAAFSLIQSLDGGVRTQAVIADRALGDIVSGPGRELDLKRFEGVPLARLNEAQRGGILRILELYAGTMRQEIAAAALAKVREAGLEALHFAWAGSLARGRPHYFRVHGPSRSSSTTIPRTAPTTCTPSGSTRKPCLAATSSKPTTKARTDGRDASPRRTFLVSVGSSAAHGIE